jgi:hypothetical protein
MIEGLATFEIMKMGIFIVFIVCLLGSAIYGVTQNMRKDYHKTTGIITTDDVNGSQSIIYTVDDKEYIQTVLFKTTITNNVTTKTPTHVAGPCTIYYSSKNPNDYSINVSPVLMTKGISIVLCVISILAILYFIFLRKNRNLAGVMGGVNIGTSLLNRIVK